MRSVQKAVKAGELEKLRSYYGRLPDVLEHWCRFGFLMKVALWVARRPLFKKLANYDDAPGAQELFEKESFRRNFARFFLSTLSELQSLNDHLAKSKRPPVPVPGTVVFGHTHDPFPPRAIPDLEEPRIKGTVVNTGGWLALDGAPAPWAIYRYETGKPPELVLAPAGRPDRVAASSELETSHA